MFELSEEDTQSNFRRKCQISIVEQGGYDPRRLNRIKFRREHELEEFNFGIDFTKIKQSKEQ